MTPSAPTPEQDRVADALSDHWVDTRAPAEWRPYLRLSRIERPIGTWLLYAPCLWGIALAALAGGDPRWRDLYLALACGGGAFLMRGAGCTWNDITDRDIDGRVARTANRPLARGDASVRQALAWAGLQCLLALTLLLTMNGAAIALGALALLPVAIYPFAKRFTWWPQAFLGIAFNWGALLGYAAHAGRLDWAALALFAAGIAWTLFYDTIYAQQDVEDDALIGVKSTARLFGSEIRRWLRRFMVAAVLLFALAVMLAAPGPIALFIALGAPWVLGWHMAWQLARFDPEKPAQLIHVFRSNREAGLFPLIFMMLAMIA